MNKAEDYASDSDQSDEDFNPENIAGDSDVASEAESEEEENDDDVSCSDEETTVKKSKKIAKKRKQDIEKTIGISDSNSRRSTRHTEAKRNGAGSSGTVEKQELESDEETDKSRSDALWADFLGDVKVTETTKVVTKSTKPMPEEEQHVLVSKPKQQVESKEPAIVIQTNGSSAKKVTITEVLDFAGEQVVVQKTVSADSIKENKAHKPATTTNKLLPSPGLLGIKRPAGAVGSPGGAGGLGSILNQLGKKKKMSVLEKSQHDWNSFKQNEGIEEELQTHNKGKDGYLERQDFLQRTDLRQFEIEKNLRQTRRQN